MSLVLAIATYLIIWVITLFAVLPFGVRTAAEAGERGVAGQADSAPMRPMLAKKALWTTLVATIIFALYYANFVNGWLMLEDIPGWHDRGPYRPKG
jgi:predicted secreted protein